MTQSLKPPHQNSLLLQGPNRKRKLNTKFFFSNFSGTSGISRQNPGISHQKVWLPWFRGTMSHTELFGPTWSRSYENGSPTLTSQGFLFGCFLGRLFCTQQEFGAPGWELLAKASNRRNPKCSPFGAPLFFKAPQEKQSQPPKCRLAPWCDLHFRGRKRLGDAS